MHLALVHCGKEWRAQRGLLAGYTLLVFAGLCLGFVLLPKSWWAGDGNRAFALACFVAAGVIGVVGFAAPMLVQREFGPKGDQFVRRLPGALAGSFAGKLLFLALATAALPLLGLLVGELFLGAIGQYWDDLFRWQWDGSVGLVPPWPLVYGGLALLLAPWVWAVGTAVPGGRMAIGGTALLVLLLAIAVTAALRQHPNLADGIAWQHWLWAVVPLGIAVAWVAWVRGRRGGGALRSARLGLAATLLGLAPPGAWLAAEAWRYRHPDPQRLAAIDVRGLTPDLRFALVLGNEHEDWQPATFRIDLASGAAERVAGFDSVLLPAAYAGFVGRWWIDHGRTSLACDWFDLATGDRASLAIDARGNPVLSPEQQRLVAEATRAATPFRAPGDRRVWFEGDEISVQTESGVARLRAGETILGARAQGHALVLHSRQQQQRMFVPATRSFPNVPDASWRDWALVGDVLLLQQRNMREWQRQPVGGASEPCPQLQNARVLGLADDEWVLALASDRAALRLFLFRPADDRVEVVQSWPPSSLRFRSIFCPKPLGGGDSLLPRDPEGRIWLAVAEQMHSRILRLDVAHSRLEELRTFTLPVTAQLLAFEPGEKVLIRDRASIERVDLRTGKRTTLFPRAR